MHSFIYSKSQFVISLNLLLKDIILHEVSQWNDNYLTNLLVDEANSIIPLTKTVKNINQPTEQKGWKCKICGYVYEGETLPDDFRCPVCGQGKEEFEKLS